MRIHLIYGAHRESPIELGKCVPLDIDVDGQKVAHLYEGVDGALHIELYRHRNDVPAQLWEVVDGAVQTVELFRSYGDALAWARAANQREGNGKMYFAQPKPRQIR